MKTHLPKLLAFLLAAAVCVPALAAEEGTPEAPKVKEKRRVVVKTPGEDPQMFVWNGEPGDVMMLSGKGGYLGVALLDLTPELCKYFGVPGDDGVLVSRVEPDSPAAKAGLRVGDVITALGAKKLQNAFDLRREVRKLKNGDAVTLEVVRERKVQTVQATAAERERQQVDVREFVGPGDFDIHVDPEEIQRHVSESMKHFNSPEMQQKLKRTQDLEQRMRELEQKLADMEQQLNKK